MQETNEILWPHSTNSEPRNWLRDWQKVSIIGTLTVGARNGFTQGLFKMINNQLFINRKRNKNDKDFDANDSHFIGDEVRFRNIFVASTNTTVFSSFWNQSRESVRHSSKVIGIFLEPPVWRFPFS